LGIYAWFELLFFTGPVSKQLAWTICTEQGKFTTNLPNSVGMVPVS